MSNYLFDVNLEAAASWTMGEEWNHCNPAESISGIYHRIYSESEDSDPVYRVQPGDNFFIGAAKSKIRDWSPRTLPWNFDLDGEIDGKFSFHFGVQVGSAGIDTKAPHAPYLINIETECIQLNANYHRFYSLKARDSQPLITLKKDIIGGEIHGAVLNNTPLLETSGFKLTDWQLRHIVSINATQKMIDVPAGAVNFSQEAFAVSGTGDIGMVVRSGHTGTSIVGGLLQNRNHNFSETETLYHGLVIESGDLAKVRNIKFVGFSGEPLHFDCESEIKGITSEQNGSGIYFGENAVARDCQVSWLRQVSGDSFAYYANKDLELNNSGCQLDETGGLGVIAMGEGSTVTVNGGDYRFKQPLPFAAAMGDSTIVLNKVKINGTTYSETITLEAGESWRGVKSEVITETLPVYGNAILVQPYMHMAGFENVVSVQGSERPTEEIINLPSGAKLAVTTFGGVRYMPSETALALDPGETLTDSFRWSTETNIYNHKFIIQASPEVSAKVVQPEGFTGSGWSYAEGAYSANNSSVSLSANYAFEEREIYQVSVKLSDLQSGSVKPELNGFIPEYSHTIEGTEVWLLRAPANTSAIDIVPDSFTGDISNIYVRKLIRTEPPAVPELEASVSGTTVNLAWYLDPIKRISDTENPRVYITGELNYGTNDGYFDRDGGFYLFEDVYSVGNKSGINLRGGTSLEVWKMDVTGGYTGANKTWQAAVAPEMNTGPYFKIMQFCYVKGTLGLTSNNGWYEGPTGNTDGLIMNGVPNIETSEAKAFVLGFNFEGVSDGLIDTKKRTEVNHSTLTGGYRQLRIHTMGTTLVTNCDFYREYGTKETFAPTHSFSLAEIWNTYADGVRCVTIPQMKEQVNPSGLFADTGVADIFRYGLEVLKTYPTIDDHCRVAMTDMEFEYSTDSESTWQSLNVPNVGLPGVVGSFDRAITLSSGTYQIRCRCLNGALIGDWSNSVSITV